VPQPTGDVLTTAPSKVIVVVLKINSLVQGPVAIVQDWNHWKEWFKRGYLQPSEEVTQDNCSYLEIRDTKMGTRYLYSHQRVLLYPEAADVSGDAADRQQSSGA
jgi:uncharacterized membrane protein